MAGIINPGIPDDMDNINIYNSFETIKNELKDGFDGVQRSDTFKRIFELFFAVPITDISDIEEDINNDESLQTYDYMKEKGIIALSENFGIFFDETSPLVDLELVYELYRILYVNFIYSVVQYIEGSLTAEEFDFSIFKNDSIRTYGQRERLFITPYLYDENDFEALRFFDRILLVNKGEIGVTKIRDLIASNIVNIDNVKFRTRITSELDQFEINTQFVLRLISDHFSL